MGWKVEAKQDHLWEGLATTVQDYIGSLNWSYKRGLKSLGVKYYHNYAYFVDPHTLEYEEKKKTYRVTSKYFVIATGGRPNYGDFPGKEICLSSDDLFWLKKSPGKTLVIGAGYIALECAGFLHELGLDVTVMVRSKVMRKFDEQVAGQIGELMERSGIRFLMPANAVSFKKVKDAHPVPPEGSKEIIEGPRKGQIQYPDEEGKARYQHPSGAIETVDSKTGESTWKIPKGKIEVEYKYFNGDKKIYTEQFDTVLLAIARNPNVKGIGLDKAGVELNLGKIVVDDFERTSVEHIFSVGDVSTGIKKHGKTAGAAVLVSVDGSHTRGVVSAVNGDKLDIRLTEGKNKDQIVTHPKDAVQYQSKERPELTPVAIQSGIWLSRRLFSNFKLPMNYMWIPSTVFTTPEYGFCGLTTEEAEMEEAEGGIGKENVEVWWSRFGPIEQTPLHPHFIDPRSHYMIGKNLWARQYADENKIYWPDTGFDEKDYNLVTYDDGKKQVDAIVTAVPYQNDAGHWVYDIKVPAVQPADGKAEEIKGVPANKLELRGESARFRFERYVKSNHLAKLVVDKRSDKVIGFHFIGNNAGEVTQGFSLALLNGATKAQFDQLVGIHPTAAEEFAVLDVNRSSGENFLKQEGCGGGSC